MRLTAKEKLTILTANHRNELDAVETHIALKNRDFNPDGEFDKEGRWYPDVITESIGFIRPPSIAYPYSLMNHCRSLRYVAQTQGADLDICKKILSLTKKIAKQSHMNHCRSLRYVAQTQEANLDICKKILSLTKK